MGGSWRFRREGVAVDLLRLSQFVEISCRYVNRLFQKDSSFSLSRSFWMHGVWRMSLRVGGEFGGDATFFWIG